MNLPSCTESMLPPTIMRLCQPLLHLFMLSLIACVVGRVGLGQADGQERLIDHFPEAASSGCMACHQEVEPIREIGSEMLNQIMAKGKAMGDPAGCVVCHNGDPNETQDATIAHGGDNFYRDPGSPWVNENTCGTCHEDQVKVQWQAS